MLPQIHVGITTRCWQIEGKVQAVSWPVNVRNRPPATFGWAPIDATLALTNRAGLVWQFNDRILIVPGYWIDRQPRRSGSRLPSSAKHPDMKIIGSESICVADGPGAKKRALRRIGLPGEGSEDG